MSLRYHDNRMLIYGQMSFIAKDNECLSCVGDKFCIYYETFGCNFLLKKKNDGIGRYS